ncbi:SGNH/GDSL hydrolase family protein [Rufibacter soli]
MRFLANGWLLLVSMVFLGACDSTSDEDAGNLAPQPTAGSGSVSTYLALGDSYTIGQSVAPEERWPMHLANLLSPEGIRVGEPRIIAQTGWTTANLLQQVKAQNLSGGYGLVSLMIGVNNQYQGRSLEEFRTQFKELLALSTQLAQKDPKNVVVLTIPDWGATPFGASYDRAYISAQVQKFNEVIKTEATTAGIKVIDIYDLSLMVSQNPSLLAPDGLHYSSLMHRQWAQRVLPEAKRILTD